MKWLCRHCQCIYYHDWHRTNRPKPAVKDAILPAVSRAVSHQPTVSSEGPSTSTFSSPRNTLVSSSGIVIAVNEEERERDVGRQVTNVGGAGSGGGSLPFDEEAKLVYGVILSLRTMMKKLSKRDEQFTAYRTSAYKLHLYETLSLYKFVLLTDPRADSTASSPTPVRFALRQIYSGPFLEYVVRNPLVSMDSRERGIDNEYFRASVDRLIRGLSIFQ